MQNQLFRTKSSHPMLQRLAFTFRTSPTHSKNILNMIKLKLRSSVEATQPLKRERAKTINCHRSDILLWNFHTKISSLSNRFSTFDKNVNLSRINPEAENFFLAFPLAKIPRFFTTYLKIANTLTPFEGPRPRKSPSQIPKFNFLKQTKKVNTQNGKVFKLYP